MILKSNYQKLIGLSFSFLFMLSLIGLSVGLGYANISLIDIIHSFIYFNTSNEHLIIQTVRVPRALIAASVGASLAVSGVFMQTLTKNPLASPGIFGVNAGAGFFIVVAVTIFQVGNLQAFAWISFLGAAVASLSVYAISSFGRDGLTPLKITLAGAAITAMFGSFTQGLLVLNEVALEQVLFWLAGSVQGRKLELLLSVLPYLIIGGLLALIISPKLNVLAMGEDVAKGLGLKLGRIKIVMAIVVILLAGSAVAIAGPIGFIGIVIPHVAKKFIGIDHRWLVPFSAVLGAILLLSADIGARFIIFPQEVPVGVMTAIIGTPFFIFIARRGFNGQ
ncbi:iron ABC transporter [Lottiidibacillus patelloidae]|uniref:Iron ABC transporter n=1 Tax=Lottiidibacillus patelloidae TaxID=2670334 RepID=A0A263BSC5_9BACI|nr:iron ABC transporter permease [Lottiidibacillus patelloidae]OZM56631.1 iron ABC transporter [Lottiidibacillus patelloidae]